MDVSNDTNDDYLSCPSPSDSLISLGSDSTNALTLHDEISSITTKFPRNLNLAHINAQSVPGHYSDLLASFSSTNLDAILISETFLKPSLPSTHYVLPGYVLVRNDRLGKGGGGVGIYMRADIPYRIASASPSQYSQSAEHLFLEITLIHTKILLGVFYSPNLNIDYFKSFEDLLYEHCPNFDQIIIMGDFNTCLMKKDVRSRNLLSILSTFNLQILPLSPTHHFPNSTPTLLDLIIISSPDKISTHCQLSAPFSYHDLVFLSYSIRPPKRRSQFRFLRNFKGMNVQELRRDASCIDWTGVLEANNINDMTDAFNKKITSLFDSHAPIRRIKIKKKPAPWLADDIKQFMGFRDRAKRRYRRSPTDRNLHLYKVLRNRCNRMCRDAKRAYFQEHLNNRNATDVWKFLKSVGIGKNSTEGVNNLDINSLNKHFSEPPLILDTFTKSSTLKSISELPVLQIPPFQLNCVTETDVHKSISSISSSATGNDNICSNMIKFILSEILSILTFIFNYSISSCSFPETWKRAHIIPLAKISNPTSPSHFRPISILPFLSKVLEHIVHRQLSSFLTKYNLLSSFQSGFRSGHSTVTALIKVTDDIRWAMEKKQLTILVLLDFSSAFNSVDFDILLGVLKSLNISSTAITWFESYLRRRFQCARVDQTYSEWRGVCAGVPQGGVLSPLLFSIFINSVTIYISSHVHLYADDLQLYLHFPEADANLAISKINNDLIRLGEWARSYGLLLNPNKSQAMIIGSKYFCSRLDAASLAPISVSGTVIPLSNTAKNLGVIFDNNLTWEAHVNGVCKKVHFTFHSLKCLQSFLPIKTKIALAQTLLQPLIDYADVCYLDAKEELLDKLEKLQNLCIRFVYNLKKYDHVSHFRKELKWLPIRLRRNTRILCLLFNILHNQASPPYLRERFSFSRPPDARSNVRLDLTCPAHRTGFFSYSYSVHAVRLWNSLPAKIRESPSVTVFKRKVRQHYLSSLP